MGISLLDQEARMLDFGTDSLPTLLGVMGHFALPGQTLPLPFELWSRALFPQSPRLLRHSEQSGCTATQRQRVRKGEIEYIFHVQSNVQDSACHEAPSSTVGVTFARIPNITSSATVPSKYDTFGCVVAGTLARTMAQVTIHPIDTVKTRLQVHPGCDVLKSWRKAARSSGLKLKLFSRSLHLSNWAAKGVGDLYLGLAANVLGTLPTAFVYFATYEHSKRWLSEGCSGNGLNPLVHLLSASAGAITSAFIRVPADTLKHQLQAYKYRTMQTALYTIYRSQGPSGLYRGMAATLVRDVPEIAIQFAVYEALRRSFLERAGRGEAEQLKGVEILGLGATAGAAAAAVTMPLDVVKTRQQVVNGPPSSFFTAFKSVAATGGLPGFFSGLGPRLVQTSLMSAIFFTCFEFWKAQLAGDPAPSNIPPNMQQTDIKFDWRVGMNPELSQNVMPLSLYGMDSLPLGQPRVQATG